MTLAVEAYTDTANTLRQIAITETSNRVLGFSREKKNEVLRQLRSQYENGRKLFIFALTNSGEST